MSVAITDKAKEELEGALMLLITSVREYRDREQKALGNSSITVSELMRTVGAVTALKNVESVLGMVAELYGLKV